MLTIGPQIKVFLAAQPVDMRKSFDSLAALVDETLQLDPLSGHLFVFRSRRGDRLKILYWDEHGFTLFYRRLEEGTFRFPAPRENESSLTISATDLVMLLDGVDLSSVKRRPRYRRPA